MEETSVRAGVGWFTGDIADAAALTGARPVAMGERRTSPGHGAPLPVIHADDETSLSYRVVGEGPHTVVLLHGWLTTGAVFDPLIEQLPLQGLRLLIPDLRGAGASGPSRSVYRLWRFARDVLAIADAEGARTFTVVGHAMGGQIAQRLALAAPDRLRGMFLMCSLPASGQEIAPSQRAFFQRCAGDAEKLGHLIKLSARELPDTEFERLLAIALTLDAGHLSGAFEAWTDGFAGALEHIRTPTVVLATDDPYYPLQVQETQVAGRIPGARLCYLPGPGQLPQGERPAETAAILASFLGGLGTAAPREAVSKGPGAHLSRRLRPVRCAHG